MGPVRRGALIAREAGRERTSREMTAPRCHEPSPGRTRIRARPYPGVVPAQTPDAPPRTVLLAAGVTVVLWASAFIAIRGAIEHFSPGAMALVRMAVGAAVLGLIVARPGLRVPGRRDLALVAVWGIAWFCLYNLALNTAERTVDAGTAALLVNLAPLIVVLLAGVLLGEGLPRSLVIGAPVSFGGVALIAAAGERHATAGGVLLGVAAAFLYAGCTLLQKRLLERVDPASLTFLGAVAGALALLPWAPQLIAQAARAPLGATLAVVYLGVFPTAIAFSTWAYVLRRMPAGQTAATTYAVPAVAIVLSWLLLGEAPTAVMLVGGALCLLGVHLTRRR